MWYYQQGSNRMGPVDEATIRGLLASGQISIDTLVWTTGMSSWAPLQQSPLGSGLPTPTSAVPTYQTNPNAKDRVAYILLAFFLGGLGIHNFYSGHNKHGFIKLGLMAACGVGLIVNPIWCIIEMITVTKDADGVNFN